MPIKKPRAEPKKEKATIVRVNVSLNPDVYRKAREKSKQTGVPISFVFNRALEKWVGGQFAPSDD